MYLRYPNKNENISKYTIYEVWNRIVFQIFQM